MTRIEFIHSCIKGEFELIFISAKSAGYTLAYREALTLIGNHIKVLEQELIPELDREKLKLAIVGKTNYNQQETQPLTLTRKR